MSGVVVLATAGLLLVALGAPALAQSPAPAGQQAAPPPVAEPQPPRGATEALPEAWTRIGQLFMQLIDARIQLEVEQRVDAMIQKRLQEPLSALEQRLVQATNDFRLTLDDQNARIAALEQQSAQLRSQLQAKDAEMERLRSDVQALQRRFWIAIGGAVVGIIVAILR